MESDIYNYCQTLVFNRLKSMPEASGKGADFINDVACIALNRIKPRYIREPIFLYFHITDIEWAAMHAEVADAVDFSLNYIEKNLKSAPGGHFTQETCKSSV